MAEPALSVELAQGAPIPARRAVRVRARASCSRSSGRRAAARRPSCARSRVWCGLVRARCAATARPGWTSRLLPPQARHVGLVFQSYALFPHLSASGNVQAALPVSLGRAARAAAARELLEFVAPRRARDRAAARALRRPAAARRPRAGARARPEGAAARRAVLGGGPGDAPPPAARARADATAPANPDRARDARPRGGRDARRPHGGAASRPDAPVRTAVRRARAAEDARWRGSMDFRNLFHGEVVAQDAAAGTTLLRWEGHELEATHRPELRGRQPRLLGDPAGALRAASARPAVARRAREPGGRGDRRVPAVRRERRGHALGGRAARGGVAVLRAGPRRRPGTGSPRASRRESPSSGMRFTSCPRAAGAASRATGEPAVDPHRAHG